MSLIGTYQNNSTGETLQITNVNSDLSTFKGSLQLGKSSLPVVGEFRFLKDSKPPLILTFSAAINDPNTREVWTGTTNSYQELHILGVRATLSGSANSVSSLAGSFVRVSDAETIPANTAPVS